ncbi:hypothetical protein JCM11251_002251 [Rhodosporidiobolus azoricus]
MQQNLYSAAPPQQQYYQQQEQQPYGANAPRPPHGTSSYGAPPVPPARYESRPPPTSHSGGYSQAGYGGGGNHGQPAPPASRASQGRGPNAQLWAYYNAVDADQSGAISEVELKQALVNGDWSHFSRETIKMLMTMFDVNRSGTIGFDEFVGLWQCTKRSA